MMKLILSLTLLLVFSTTAQAIQCQTCTNDDCSSTTLMTCSSETMCVTANIQATPRGSSSSTTESIFKGCAASSVCPTTGDRTFAADVGPGSVLAAARCCDTDDCNGPTLPAPTPQSDNGRRCFFCLPGQTECQSILPCNGVEDRCFQGAVTSSSGNSPLFGCISQSICDAASDLTTFPLLQSFGSVTSGPTCCRGDQCNDRTITTAAPTTSTLKTTSSSTPMRSTPPMTAPTAAPTANPPPATDSGSSGSGGSGNTTPSDSSNGSGSGSSGSGGSGNTTPSGSSNGSGSGSSGSGNTTPSGATVSPTTAGVSCVSAGLIHLLLGLLMFTISQNL